MKNEVIVRRPKVEDVEGLYNSILRSVGGETKITLSSLKEDLFGKSTKDPIVSIDDPSIEFDYDTVHTDFPFIKAYLAEVADKVVGHIVYHYYYTPWYGHLAYVDDIFIEPEYREQEVGEKLAAQVSRESNDLGFRVESVIGLRRDCPEIQNLAEKVGAESIHDEKTDWSVWKIDFAQI